MKAKGAPIRRVPSNEVNTLESTPNPNVIAVRSERYLLALICIAVLCAILMLGLWPFHAPRNGVAWLGNHDGLRFEGYSTVISYTALSSATLSEAGSLEVWLRPERISESATFLAFYTLQNPLQFSLHQSLGNFELRTERPHAGPAHLFVHDVFRKTAPVFIAITSGAQGTAVYIEGALAKRVPGLQIPANNFTGQVVLGDSPRQGDPWSGGLFGVAVYHRELVAAQVLRHYQTWAHQGRPQIAPDERNVALYLFDEHTGNVVHNRAGTGADLFIPERYVILGQVLLEPVWNEFEMSRSYWGNAAKNIVGFIPVGFCFYAYFSSALGIKRAAVFTVILGSFLSLTIEVLQAYLPTRDSGTTDLITNTLGTWIGVASYRLVAPTLGRLFPWLPFTVARK